MRVYRLIFVFLLCASYLLAQTADQAKTGKIRGTVIDTTTGQALPKVILKLMPLHFTGDATEPPSATTDLHGEYEFRSVEPGEYFVMANKTGYVERFYGKSSSPYSRGTPISIAPGATVSGIDFKLGHGGVISGHVLNEDGEPFPNVHIVALQYWRFGGRKRLSPRGNAQTDDRGEYRMHDLRPGSYFLLCEAQMSFGPNSTLTDAKHAYPPTYYPSTTSADGATQIKVTEGSEAGANFSLSPVAAYTIRGSITGVSGSVNIMLGPVSRFDFGMGPQTYTNSSTFELGGVLPGSYNLVATTNDDETQRTVTQKVTIADADLNGVKINFENNAPEIRGSLRVMGDAKADVSNLYVSALEPLMENDDDLSFYSYGRNNGEVKKDGSFSLAPPSGGRIYIGVSASRLPDAYVKSVALGTREVIDSGFIPVTGASLDVVLSPFGASVEGLVLDKKGKPFPGALVFTIPEESRRDRRDLYQVSVSDQRGYFQLRGVAPGTYKVIAVEDPELGPPFDSDFLKAHLSDAPDLKAEEKGKYNLRITIIPAQASK